MIKPAFNEDLFNANWELLAQINPLAAYRLEFVWEEYKLTPCETEKGEFNLCSSRYGIKNYYHSQKGALDEAQAQLSQDVLAKADVLYIFGLGLGYFYDAILPWLQQNQDRHVVFLEDDLEVISYFLHTERAADLLRNPQVTLFYFHEYIQDYDRFCQLLMTFSNRRLQFLTLPYYAAKREIQALILCYNILHDSSLMSTIHNEYLSGQTGFLANFYRNFLLMYQSSYAASGLFGQFKNIPAIICGAGPSIHKNIYLLKSLADRALIFAGGSSLNVLNHVGITPHFGLGVDPNSEQYHRLLANHTFYLPYLYRPRVSHEAFQLMQGPKLYIPGSVNRLASWFEKKLDMPAESIDEGHNVVNLCTEIAYRMGCNPIIYVGMDLAFTEIQSYASGINTHPLWIELSQPYSTTNLETVRRQDINGKWINTKWDWIAESAWLSHFAQQHPDVKMINATEGGLGFAPVPNYPLAEVANQYLKKSYDLSDWVHADIQNSKLNIKQSTIFNLITEVKMSLTRCINILKQVIEEKTPLFNSTEDLSQVEFYTPQTILQESEMQNELGYQHFLTLFENAYLYIQNAKQMTYHRHPPSFSQHLGRYHFLLSIANQNINLMTRAVHRFITSPPPITYSQESRSFSHPPKEVYQFSEGRLQIKDPELGIFIDDLYSFTPQTDRLAYYYPNEQLKGEMFYFEQRLHGPSRFYNPQGGLLAESWFFKGNCEGKSLQYYPSGNVSSIRRFKHNLLFGKQEYFYENGTPHVIMHYQEGFLHGEVLIYTITGKLIRELHYHKGQRHGVEKMWDNNGQLLMECHYQEGTPVGQARQWDPKGWLFKEVTFHRFPNDFDLSIWNAEGKRIQFFEHGIEDFSALYEDTQKTANELDATLQGMLKQLYPLVEQKFKDSPSDIEEQFSAIKDSIQEMQKLRTNLDEIMQDNLKRAEEAKRKQQLLGQEE
ncbi:6-hydroxymethylpterin diphosphokinase MptE-like protein [Candidatus Protochlamydia phocaeensis]|uniref:6-hydroxymethylpterin diphosphokinase MptE-like protein n=1 Tax=Candidatus Protochlamydia phocaeensis TaxID=1414722 RepID=UPI00083993E8|nr:6-hydroxymethylpterin diphosphokinase MptE-like protein [Candidatus Protochlamydia phocaeensis]